MKLKSKQGAYFATDSFNIVYSLALFRNKEVKAMITTGEGKFFSNGLDLQSLISSSKEPKSQAFLQDAMQLIARILTFPAVTIAALNGEP